MLKNEQDETNRLTQKLANQRAQASTVQQGRVTQETTGQLDGAENRQIAAASPEQVEEPQYQPEHTS
eukprot:1073595-Amphidinium_carterae.1